MKKESNNLKGKELEDYKKNLKLTDFQRDVIVGTLLGDSSMSLRNQTPTYSIKFEQSEKNAEYVFHLYEIFKDFTGSPPSWRFMNKERTRRSLWFRTYRYDGFIYYWNMFYKNEEPGKRKVIPKNIKKLLNPRVLAYWFMDDGNLSSDRKSFYINTQGFTKPESEKLCQILKQNFNITATVQRDKNSWRIYIWRESAETFLKFVKPYIVSCFDYKLCIV